MDNQQLDAFPDMGSNEAEALVAWADLTYPGIFDENENFNPILEFQKGLLLNVHFPFNKVMKDSDVPEPTYRYRMKLRATKEDPTSLQLLQNLYGLNLRYNDTLKTWESYTTGHASLLEFLEASLPFYGLNRREAYFAFNFVTDMINADAVSGEKQAVGEKAFQTYLKIRNSYAIPDDYIIKLEELAGILTHSGAIRIKYKANEDIYYPQINIYGFKNYTETLVRSFGGSSIPQAKERVWEIDGREAIVLIQKLKPFLTGRQYTRASICMSAFSENQWRVQTNQNVARLYKLQHLI